MVVVDACPICRKPVLRTDPTAIAARVRGLPEDVMSHFHARCYPGDEGTVFERVDKDEPDTE